MVKEGRIEGKIKDCYRNILERKGREGSVMGREWEGRRGVKGGRGEKGRGGEGREGEEREGKGRDLIDEVKERDGKVRKGRKGNG